jgi:PTS system mannose-specific IIB component/fructoselysine and glucoselysine-specific PTS system IIB component
MPVVLYRVDDRLVHGQVVIGWGRPLNVGFVALVDDTVATSAWEQELYRMGVPAEVELIFASVAEARQRLPAWQADPRNGIVLTPEIGLMAALAEGGGLVPRVNLGGIHHKPGRSQRLPYVYLTDEEYQALRALADRGVEITAQDLPTTAAVSLAELA